MENIEGTRGGGGKAGGAKRKAPDNSNERTDGTTDQRKTKNVKVAQCRTDGAVSLHDIDLLTRIASFMQPGKGVMSICVVAGPAEAGGIRQEYLTGNNEYVSSALKRLIVQLGQGLGIYDKILDASSSFDKCRSDIEAWMKYNNWKSRCTESNLKRYKKHKMLRFQEANFPFNCLNFAVQLGLLEVTRYLVEDRLISANDGPCSWDRLMFGFHPSNHMVEDRYSTLKVAIVLGDVTLVNYLLNMRTHDDESILDALFFAVIGECKQMVGDEMICFLARHPMMIIDDAILEEAVNRFGFSVFTKSNPTIIKARMETASMLLDLANSRGMTEYEIPFAKKRAQQYLSHAETPSQKRILNEVFEKMP